MRTLIADCSNFVLEHLVYVVDDNTGNNVAIMHLPTSEIVNYAMNDTKVHLVKLFGIKEFCNGIKEDIEKQLSLDYSNRKIEIEVL